jgi:hypothetical protein
MNELLEKAGIDYPKGTKIKSMFKDLEHTLTGELILCNNGIQSINQNGLHCNIYDKEQNKWAEIINTSTMTQQKFNDLKIGDFINNYEILHKYNEFLIVKCDDGHDLFDLNKINKLGLKVQPKTFMGLEVKEYDNVPCEIDGNCLVYLVAVWRKYVLIRRYKTSTHYDFVPTSIRIL